MSELKMESRKDPLDFYKCDFCGYGTKSLFHYLRHVRQHQEKWQGYPNAFDCHNNVLEIYKCKNCDFETNLQVSLTHHFNLNHNNDLIIRNQNQFINVLKHCRYCGFQTYSSLILLKHHFKCDGGEEFRSEANKITNWLECGQCSYRTHIKWYIRRHIKDVHSTNLTLFQCERCPFKTKLKRYLLQHVSLMHSNIERFKCDKCFFKYKSQRSLQYHKLVKHCDNKKWLECANCEYKSMFEHCLKRHIHYNHSKPENFHWYHCDKCKRKFKRKEHFKLHIKNIHGVLGNIVWYHCDICEFKTKWKGALKKHTTNVHIAVHIDPRNIVWYHCDNCEYKTKRKADLRRHIKYMHTDSADIIWYHCDKCDYKCKEKSRLKRHKGNIHKIR